MLDIVVVPFFGFNPCFSGFGVIIAIRQAKERLRLGFNPCFSGFGVIMALLLIIQYKHPPFQSLF